MFWWRNIGKKNVNNFLVEKKKKKWEVAIPGVSLFAKDYCVYPGYVDIETWANIVDPDQVPQSMIIVRLFDSLVQLYLCTSAGSEIDLFKFYKLRCHAFFKFSVNQIT